jgi:peptide chain release factor 1
MSLSEKLQKLIERRQLLEEKLSHAHTLPSEEFVKFSKEHAEIQPVADAAIKLQTAQKEQDDLQTMLKDPSLDPEMKSIAQEEVEQLKHRIPEIEHEIKVLLLPKDEADERNAIIEIRAGTGGDEAALFAKDLLEMYEKYALLKGWKFELLHLTETDIGGVKDLSVSIAGKNVFARLKFESGVHRVQRVPETETQGRVHTSAATVAVLPEAEEVDIHIEEKDLRIDTYRASGAGGQHVNKTDSAVRITHIPTGVVVQQQDEKSQHKNRARALKILRARLYDIQREKIAAERAKDRKQQIGSGDRSERIRTYNFPQGRVSDHRINLTLYKIDLVMQGEALDEIIEPLIAESQAQMLAEVNE